MNFEDIAHHKTFAKQFKAYQQQHPKSLLKTLDDFAKNVVENPRHYQPTTIKRATTHKKKSESLNTNKNNIIPATLEESVIKTDEFYPETGKKLNIRTKYDPALAKEIFKDEAFTVPSIAIPETVFIS